VTAVDDIGGFAALSVATVFDMETINGVDHVIDLCLVVGGELKEVRAFYYPSQGPR
jgi:hypothetical protein